MLRKAAGKSFFRPVMKMRNALEMAGEWTESEIEDDDSMDVIDAALDKAKSQVKPEPQPEPQPQADNIKDAEFEEVEEVEEVRI